MSDRSPRATAAVATPRFRPSWRLRTLLFLVALPFAAPSAVGDEVAVTLPAEWRPLFDGQSLTNWRATPFGGPGEVYVEENQLHFEFGSPLTGITYTGEPLPTEDYELRLEAKKLEGSDFFCGLTFPVRDSHCSLIVGGWGGSLVGLSSLDDRDASDNETGKSIPLRVNQWYAIRVEVRRERIRVWIDDEPVIDQSIADRKVSLRAEVELCKPLGLCTFETRAAVRKIELRQLPKQD